MSSYTVLLMLLLPLIGGLMGYASRSTLMPLIGTVASLLIALMGIIGLKENVLLVWDWLPGFEMSVMVDQASLLLIALVALVSFLVQVFSREYMKDDQGKNRFFAKLGLFITAMIGLLLADNLLLLFVFWELVGLASYLLIGFWYKKRGST